VAPRGALTHRMLSSPDASPVSGWHEGSPVHGQKVFEEARSARIFPGTCPVLHPGSVYWYRRPATCG